MKKKISYSLTETLPSLLMAYDTKTNSWSYRACPPDQTNLLCAQKVVVNKDIYFVGGNLYLRYSTTEDKWSTMAKPPYDIGAGHGAICGKEILFYVGLTMTKSCYSHMTAQLTPGRHY